MHFCRDNYFLFQNFLIGYQILFLFNHSLKNFYDINFLCFMSDSKKFKLVVIGDQSVGKTCFVYTYANDKFPTDFVPSIYEPFVKPQIQIHDIEKKYEIEIIDSFGQIQTDLDRWNLYEDADLYLLCFSVVDPPTFQNVYPPWIEMIESKINEKNEKKKSGKNTKNKKSDHPDSLYLLVGLKTDLRGDRTVLNGLQSNGMRPIMPEEGKVKASEIGAFDYVECSALSGNGVKEVFDQAIMFLDNPDNEGNCCFIH